MIDWLLDKIQELGRALRRAIQFFSLLQFTNHRTGARGTSSNVPDLSDNNTPSSPPISLDTLKVQAMEELTKAEELLRRSDLNRLSASEFVSSIYVHRKQLEPSLIQNSLERNNITLVDLASHNTDCALKLLQSRFQHWFTALELVTIYYKYRHDSSFCEQLFHRDRSPTPIFSLLHILKKSAEENILPSVWSILAQSRTLLSVLSHEIQKEKEKEKEKEKQNARKESNPQGFEYPQPKEKAEEEEIPRFKAREIANIKAQPDPYSILEITRNATPEEIKRGYRAKALAFHPDKFETLYGNHFKLASEAYELLCDPNKRRIWDEAHPITPGKEAKVENEAHDEEIPRILYP